MAKNTGKLLESKISSALKTLQSKTKSFGHRFVDKAQVMSGFVAPSPGDFMLLVPGKAILIECKSTNANTSLMSMAHKGEVGKRQIAHHRLWNRSGNPSVYLWMNIKRDMIEFHLGSNVVDRVDKPLFVGSSSDMLVGLKEVIEGLE